MLEFAFREDDYQKDKAEKVLKKLGGKRVNFYKFMEKLSEEKMNVRDLNLIPNMLGLHKIKSTKDLEILDY